MNAIKKIVGKYRWGFVALSTLIIAGCLGAIYMTGEEAKIVAPVFTLPEVPTMITDPADRAKYVAAHFWDNLDFADSLCLAAPDVMEQAFVDYLDVLPHATKQIADASLRETLIKARNGEVLLDWFTAQFDRYLYDPNSPMRDEERYAVVVEHILADNRIDSVYKIRPAHQLAEINKNRKGNVATDFSYILADGKRGRLHGIPSEYTLVYFYNPDCNDCKRTKEVLESSVAVSGMVSSGKLKILAFYPDEDLTAWKAHTSEIPAAWINGYAASPEVKDKLYALRAIPSLYLLDKDKRVMLKDATAEQAEAVLQRL